MSVHISNSLVIGAFPVEFPLTHTRIGWRNIVFSGDITATTPAPESSEMALKNAFTHERYKPGSIPANISIDAGSAEDVDYLGIASHNLSDTGNTVRFQYSFDASNWVTIDEFIAPDNSTIMRLTQKISARYWRIRIVGGSGLPSIGVIYIGRALAMMRPIYTGHQPITLNRTVRVRPQQSDTGQFLGSNIVRQGLRSTLEFKHLKPDWYRQNFDPFVTHAYRLPFFVAWRPQDYPSEVAFCKLPAGQQFQPQNTGQPDLMSVSVPLVGLSV